GRARAAAPEPARLAPPGDPPEPPPPPRGRRPAPSSLARDDQRRGLAEGRRPVGDDPPVTVGEAIAHASERLRAAGSETPRLDAELLLGWSIGIGRTGLLAPPDA